MICFNRRLGLFSIITTLLLLPLFRCSFAIFKCKPRICIGIICNFASLYTHSHEPGFAIEFCLRILFSTDRMCYSSNYFDAYNAGKTKTFTISCCCEWFASLFFLRCLCLLCASYRFILTTFYEPLSWWEWWERTRAHTMTEGKVSI